MSSVRAGYSVNPHYSFAHHPEIDLLVVVSGVHYFGLACSSGERPTLHI